jgi:hypothetical protein
MIDPLFTVGRSFAEKKSAADTASDAVIPARDRYIDQTGTSHRHGRSSSIDPQNLPFFLLFSALRRCVTVSPMRVKVVSVMRDFMYSGVTHQQAKPTAVLQVSRL